MSKMTEIPLQQPLLPQSTVDETPRVPTILRKRGREPPEKGAVEMVRIKPGGEERVFSLRKRPEPVPLNKIMSIRQRKPHNFARTNSVQTNNSTAMSEFSDGESFVDDELYKPWSRKVLQTDSARSEQNVNINVPKTPTSTGAASTSTDSKQLWKRLRQTWKARENLEDTSLMGIMNIEQQYDETWSSGSSQKSSTDDEAAKDNNAKSNKGFSKELDFEPLIDVRNCIVSFYQEREFLKGLFAFCFFAVYFFLFVIIILMQTSVSLAFDVEQLLTDRLFKEEIGEFKEDTMLTIIRREEVWDWLQTVWAPAMFTDFFDYPNNTVYFQGKRGSGVKNLTDTTEVVFGENKLVRAPRLIQRRLKLGECYAWKMKHRKCLGTEWETENYGESPLNGAFTANEHGDYVYMFRINTAEKPNGMNYIDITTADDAIQHLKRMETAQWLDRQSTFLVVDTLLYNPNYNLLTDVTIVFVFTASGRVIPFAGWWDDYSMHHGGSNILIHPLSMYTTGVDYFRVLLEVLFFLGTVFNTYTEAKEATSARKLSGSSILAYLSGIRGVSNFLDILLLFVTYLAILSYIIHVSAHMPTAAILDQAIMLDDKRIKSVPRTIYFVTTAMLLLLFVFRFMKFVGFYKRWKFLSTTLLSALPDLAHFSMLFMLFLGGFAIAGHYFFGHSLRSFHKSVFAFETMLQATITQGSSTLDNLNSPGSDLSWGVYPAFFWLSFTFVIFFVMINMFLAIVMRSYDQTMEESNKKELRRSIFKIIREPMHSFMLEIFADKQWVEEVYSNYPIGVWCSYNIVENELAVRVRLNRLVRKKCLSAQTLYIVLPEELRMNTLGVSESEAFWYSKAVQKLEGTVKATAINPLVISIPCQPDWWRSMDFILCYPIVLDQPIIKGGAVAGPAVVCFTKNGNLGFSLENQFDGCAFIPKSIAVTRRQLRRAPENLAKKIPSQPPWDKVVRSCRKRFPYGS